MRKFAAALNVCIVFVLFYIFVLLCIVFIAYKPQVYLSVSSDCTHIIGILSHNNRNHYSNIDFLILLCFSLFPLQ